MFLSRLVQALNGRLDEAHRVSLRGEADPTIRDLCIDSRRVSPGALFVALRGSRSNGHDYIESAVEHGALALLVDTQWRVPEGLDIPVIVASDTRAVLGELSACFFDDPMSHIGVCIGVTGTNGKTTTTYILEVMARAAEREPGVIGTINYRWQDRVIDATNTTPESVITQRIAHTMERDGVDTLIMEVSSHGLATHRLDGALFDVAVFTNLSQDHLDFHGTMRAYRDAKARLFTDYLAPGGLAVIAVGDGYGPWMADLIASSRSDTRLITVTDIEEKNPFVSSVPHGQVDIEHAELSLEGAEITLRIQAAEAGSAQHVTLRSPLLGRFNVHNVAIAATIMLATGTCSVEQVQRGLDALVGVPGRLERVNPGAEGEPAVFVDYAHTPDALERALVSLRPFCKGCLRVVFGCGGDRDHGKRGLMGQIAAEHADSVMITSDNPRSERPERIIDEILEGAFRAENKRADVLAVESSRQRAIERVLLGATEQDVVLIAGKGHETYQEFAHGRIGFDDRVHAASALQLRSGEFPRVGGSS